MNWSQLSNRPDMRGRKKLNMAAALTTLALCILLIYQHGVTSKGGNHQDKLALVYITSRPRQESYTTIANEPKNITLDDIFISIKTTSKNENTRLAVILKTWFQLAKEQTWFFTDKENGFLQNYTNGHLVNTQCNNSHSRRDLCCKTNVELDYYLDSGKKWFCHFDDDNYVNVPQLVRVLQSYDYKLDWYLGKPSTPKRAYVRYQNETDKSFKKTYVRFATGGAGICISSSLAAKMARYVRNGGFVDQCIKINRPDDITMGFILECLLETPLTIISTFHSHLEKISELDPRTFQDQVSFGYHLPAVVVRIPGVELRHDTTRFLSLHCFLFPHIADFCDN